VVILVNYLHFSDFIWIRYEFVKYLLFSGILKQQADSFYTELTLAADTDAWDHKTRQLSRGNGQSNYLTGQSSTPAIARDGDAEIYRAI
jgi:hypothetical protein